MCTCTYTVYRIYYVYIYIYHVFVHAFNLYLYLYMHYVAPLESQVQPPVALPEVPLSRRLADRDATKPKASKGTVNLRVQST